MSDRTGRYRHRVGYIKKKPVLILQEEYIHLTNYKGVEEKSWRDVEFIDNLLVGVYNELNNS